MVRSLGREEVDVRQARDRWAGARSREAEDSMALGAGTKKKIS
jgi:hypothetical protein